MLSISDIQARVEITAEGCWEWKRCRDRQGYGICTKQHGTTRAHRISYLLTHGHIPEGALVLHSCDNPPCCNPAHLRLGTHRENQAEKASKSRAMHGEAHPASRISDSQARQIFEDPRPFSAIAEQYGISQGAVSLIKSGKTWRHVTRAPARATNLARGSVHRAAKLTADQVRAIRVSGEGPSDIMRRYGISHTAATRVLKKLSYRDVE